MLNRGMKKLSAAMVLLAVLLCVFSASAEKSAEPYRQPDYYAMQEAMGEFDGEAAWEWEPWSWQFNLRNKLTMYGSLEKDTGNLISIGALAGRKSGEEGRQALKDTLAALAGISAEFPEAAGLIDSGEKAKLKQDPYTLTLSERRFVISRSSSAGPWITLGDLHGQMTDAGLAYAYVRLYRTGTLGEGDFRAEVMLDEAENPEYVYAYYYGEDAEAGTKFFTKISGILLDGSDLEQTTGLIRSQYDKVEYDTSTGFDFKGVEVQLYRDEDMHCLMFTFPEDPGDEETPAGEEETPAVEEAPAFNPAAFEGIDLSGQIEPTVLYRGNGVTVTVTGLEYGADKAQQDAIGVKVKAEKDEGVELDRIGIPLYSVNRWKGKFSFSEGNTLSMTGAAARTEEKVLWLRLNDLKENAPGFTGIGSIELSANVIPPEGKGETVRGEHVTLETGLPDSPLPGVTLYSDDTLTINLTGLKETNREDRILLGAACESRGDAMTLLVRNGVSKLNDATFYGLDLGLEIPENGRALSEIIIYKDQMQKTAGIASLDQVEDLTAQLVDYSNPGREPAEIHITREILSQILLEGETQKEQAAQELPETQVYGNAGVTLTAEGLSPDGRGLNLLMANGTGDMAYLEVHVMTVNGWLTDGYWTFKAKAGEKSRQVLPLADFIPDFSGFSEILLEVTPCEATPDTPLLTKLQGQEQKARLTIGPAAAHDDQGTVLLETDGFRVILKGARTTMQGDYAAELWMINDGSRSVRWDESHDPLNGTSKVYCTVNGKDAEPYALFSNLNRRLDPGTRAVAVLELSQWYLEPLGLRAEDVKTVDFELAVFPDADRLEYTQNVLHIE